MERQRVSIEVLKRCAECLITECESWTSNIRALHKAKAAEAEAVQKAQLKAQKQDQKDREKEIATARKAEAKLQAKAAREAEAEKAKLVAADGADGELGELDAPGKKRRRTGGLKELTEQDPPVLHEMRNFAGGSMPVVDDINGFLELVAQCPMMPTMLRLKSTPFRKVLQARPDGRRQTAYENKFVVLLFCCVLCSPKFNRL